MATMKFDFPFFFHAPCSTINSFFEIESYRWQIDETDSSCDENDEDLNANFEVETFFFFFFSLKIDIAHGLMNTN